LLNYYVNCYIDFLIISSLLPQAVKEISVLQYLKISNIGAAPIMELELGRRLNLLTGDNGLGKSFLLDIMWWALTRKWPADINSKLTAGLMAKPQTNARASIEFKVQAKNKPNPTEYSSTFDRKLQAWTGKAGRPINPGLVLYAQVDGSFAVWDPARNYWRTKGNVDIQDRPSAYVFSPLEVWNGLRNDDNNNSLLCNGLIADWAGWQKEKGIVFENLCNVLRTLSPSEQEKIEPGELTRISLDDARDMPTLKMSYNQSVPVLHASAGIRRIISLAYLLVWSWEEHKKASTLLGQKTTSQIIFLIDEIEAHLHPRWQRQIIKALLNVMKSFAGAADVQIVTATHSPLVLASVEPLFNTTSDAWFDLDFEPDNPSPSVVLTRRDFVKYGDASSWLTSEAFDLRSARSLEAENLLKQAAALLNDEHPKKSDITTMLNSLNKMLGPKDPFLFRWRALCIKKGILS
jgi:predicted ATPase